MLRLWTIQPPCVWERLQKDGTLWSTPEQEEHFEDFRIPYAWMLTQMQIRLADYGGHYPWWAYEHRPGLNSHSQPGDWVRIELAIPRDKVLLSAYGAWHYVLNGWYLPHSVEDGAYERENDLWEDDLRAHGLDRWAGLRLPEPWRSRMIASWDRIFDVGDLHDTNTIQACFERLDIQDVVAVTFYTIPA
jgi:hypothetical protein